MIVHSLRRHPLLARYAWDDREITPVRTGGATGRIGYFGPTRKLADGTMKMHKGVDLRAIVGWPAFACMAGVIGRCGWENSVDHDQGYGQRLYLIGNDGETVSVYAHLSELLVKEGDSVRPEQILGRTGTTGNADKSDPHLHWEIHIDGEPVDPLLWLEGSGDL